MYLMILWLLELRLTLLHQVFEWLSLRLEVRTVSFRYHPSSTRKTVSGRDVFHIKEHTNCKRCCAWHELHGSVLVSARLYYISLRKYCLCHGQKYLSSTMAREIYHPRSTRNCSVTLWPPKVPTYERSLRKM